MDEIEELRRDLGAAAADYNETQLKHLSHELDLMADFLLDLYVLRKSSKQRAKSTFDTSDSRSVG